MGVAHEAADARIAQLAATQHGIVALRQLRALGLTTGAINHRVRCGRLHRLHRGVFAVGHDMRALRSLIDADPTRPGARMLDRIVARMHDEPVLTRSDLEALMRDLCDAHDLPRPDVNTRVDGREVDFFWRAQHLVVETDGHETHGTRSAFERDRARDARLTVLGYRAVRFTHRQLAYERDGVAATLLGLLALAVV